ncbi:hypothetical protein PhCBS80983_g06195 [Powellomyces hirtus]|uniref:Exportin-4 n=1 Tax=Powellomyces hirtus TaxID=109895 RepID=A0A507DQD8_9FUNG|nr:hypothetical protein PhCBS80983_g06195 [Powellomyces hirtus]
MLNENCYQFEGNRKQAEKIITTFRASPNVLPACKYIIENTQRDEVTFQAVVALKEVAAREYALHPRAEMHALRDWLLEVAISRLDQLSALSEDFGDATRHPMSGYMVKSEHDQLNLCLMKRQVALLTFSALLDEFSSNRASAVGLPYNFHVKSRKTFEDGELRPVFQIVVQILQHLMHAGINMENAADLELLGICMNIMQQSLSWEFVSADDNPLLGSFETTMDNRRVRQVGRFPASWRDFIIRPEIIDMFFQLYNMIPAKNSGLADTVRQCLTQLAGVHGPVFHATDAMGRIIKDDSVQREYVAHLLRNILKLIEKFVLEHPSNISFEYSEELTCITTMSTKIIQTYRLRVLAAVPELLPFLNELGKLNIACYQSGTGDGDFYETGAHEEGDELLDLWARLVEQIEEYTEEQNALRSTGVHTQDFDLPGLMKFLTMVAFHVFETYVDMRLEAAKHSVDDDSDGDEIKDDYMYEEQLIAIGIIARLDSAKCLNKLQLLISDRVGRIRETFAGRESQDGLPYVLDHVHWLALFSGHVLAHPSRGEVPEVPRAILALSAQTPENNDPVVLLSTSLLNALEVVSVEADSPQFAMCSPLLTETLLWFVERWSETYLFIDGSINGGKLKSASLSHAFGAESGGPHILDFILRMIQKNFILWHGQEDLLMQIVNILSTFSKSAGIRNALLISETFESLIGFFLENLSRLPAAVHSPLIENIALIATHASSPEIRRHYFTRLTDAIERRLLSVIQHPNFSQKYQGPETIEHVISTMEVYSGLVLAADETNTKEIFASVSKYFDAFIQLMELYRNHTEVEKYVLQVFANLIRCQSFEELTDADCQKLYAAVLSLLKTYAKNTIGRTRVVAINEDSELFDDLSCILEILAQLMASQYEGMTWNDILLKRSAKGAVDVADVIFYGVNTVTPLISDQMLQFPELCKDYISLVSNLVRYFPDKLSVLPPALLANLVRALEFGMHNAMTEVARGAFEAITTLALYAWDESAHPGLSIEFLHSHLDRLLHKTFEMFLFLEFDSGLMDSAGEALFALVLARPRVVTQQSQPAFAQRLNTALLGLHESIARTMQTPDTADRLRAARAEGLVTVFDAMYCWPLSHFTCNVDILSGKDSR